MNLPAPSKERLFELLLSLLEDIRLVSGIVHGPSGLLPPGLINQRRDLLKIRNIGLRDNFAHFKFKYRLY